MNSSFWNIMSAVWFIGGCAAGAFLKDDYGGNTLFVIIYVAIVLIVFILLYSKAEQAKLEESDLYDRLRKLEKAIDLHDERLDYLREDIKKLENSQPTPAKKTYKI